MSNKLMEVEVVTSAAPCSALPDMTTRKHINWHNASDRKWLQSHMHWAVMNQQSVTLVPAEAPGQNAGISRVTIQTA